MESSDAAPHIPVAEGTHIDVSNHGHDLRERFRLILGPEKSFFWLAAIYGIGIVILGLAVPLSVQILIDTVANTVLTGQVILLSAVLFLLLVLAGALTAFRTHLMEVFGRRIHARLCAEISLRAIYAKPQFFEEARRAGVFHRYYDIMTLQRNIPELLIGGFTIILQGVIGVVLTSLYHPVFLAFNLALILLLGLIWRIWGPAAIRTGLDLSACKYETGEWLDHMAETNGFYKSSRHIDYALTRTEGLVERYIRFKEQHFSHSFSQGIALLLVAALGSALLLGLGGWLVIRGELTLGQLVAAELVMSAAFIGMTQFDSYLDRFYQLCMAVEEIGHIHDIPQETAAGHATADMPEPELAFEQARLPYRGRTLDLDLTIPGGASVAVICHQDGPELLWSGALKRHISPQSGRIRLGGEDMQDVYVHDLRQRISVVDRPTLIDCSIHDYLSLAGAETSRTAMFDALETVGLVQAVDALPNGIDTMVSAQGHPLSRQETLRLKLAAALLSDARLLMLGSAFDLIDRTILERAAVAFSQGGRNTLIHFTRLAPLSSMTHRLELDWSRAELTPIAASGVTGGAS